MKGQFGKHTLAAFVVCLALGPCLAWADGSGRIRWETPKDVSGDFDVVTEGQLVLAVNQSGVDTTVNGVKFTGVTKTTGIGEAENAWAGRLQTTFTARVGDAFLQGFEPTGTLSAAYRNLLCGGAYADDGARKTLTFQNLTVGHSYLVQFWVCDTRDSVNQYRDFGYSHRELVDGQVRLMYHVSPSASDFGQYVVGRFTADSTSVSIALDPESADVGWPETPPPSAQWNALQIRDVTPTAIRWETPVTIGVDSDVTTEGELVCARHFRSVDQVYEVNGVPFSRCANEASGAVVFSSSSGSGIADVFADDSTKPATVSESYLSILKGGAYANGSDATVTLRGLRPGCHYMVQVWSVDSRYFRQGSAASRMAVDNGLLKTCDEDAGRLGQFVIGRFVAAEETQSFSMRQLVNPDYPGVSESANLNAIQLRLVSGSVLESRTTAFTASAETDVSSEGTLKYAYTYAEKDLSINGTLFRRFTSVTAFDDNVTLAGLTSRADVFMSEATDFPEGDYKTLLAWGGYCDNLVDLAVTLKHLEIGKRYLVQLWVNDSRSQFGPTMTVTLPGLDEARPLKSADEPYLGPVLNCRFVARGEEDTLILHYAALAEGRIVAAQLNALQVREIVDDGAYCWTGGADDAWGVTGENWSLAGVPQTGTLWDDTKGLTRQASVGTASIRLAEDVTVNALCATGNGLTVGQPGDTEALNVAGEVLAANCTIYGKWGWPSLLHRADGVLNLAGGAEGVGMLLADAGTVRVSSDLAATAFLKVGSAATVEISGGQSLRVTEVRNEGLVSGPGALELDLAKDGDAIGGTYAGGLVLRHVNVLPVSYAGTHSGTLVLEQSAGAGRMTLQSADDGAFAAEVAEGSVIDLGGQTRQFVRLGGGGRICNGCLSGTIEVDSPILLEDVTFASGTIIRFVRSGARLEFAGDADLSGLTLTLADPASFASKDVLLKTCGSFSGDPTVVGFGPWGLDRSVSEEGDQICRLRRCGLVLIFK